MAKKKLCQLTWFAPSLIERPTRIMQDVLSAATVLDKRLGGQLGKTSSRWEHRRIAVFDVITEQTGVDVLPPSRDLLVSLDVLALRQVRPIRVMRDAVTYIGDVVDFLIHTTRELSEQKHVMSFKDASRFFTCARYGEERLTRVLRIGVFAVRDQDGEGQTYFLDYAI